MNSMFDVKTFTSLSLGLMVMACAPTEAPVAPETAEMEAAAAPAPVVETALAAAPEDADIAAARTASGALGAGLKTALVAAMQSGGPSEAVAVCNHSAPVIADSVSGEQSMTVGRTSMRVRNPNNAPDAWESAQLEAFAAAIAEGADPATLEHAEIVEIEGVETFRYMKPIMMGAVCATCHGTDVAPELYAEIKALYPEDAAVGYTPGEFRGAFTVMKPAVSE